MLDTRTHDLLSAARDALTPPAGSRPWWPGSGSPHGRTLQRRLPLVREALRIAREEEDVERATELIDQALAAHPAPKARSRARAPGHPWIPSGLRSWLDRRRWVR